MKKIEHIFVDTIPEEILDDTLYISIKYKTAIHKCCCGCGKEVVTPFSHTDWKLTFDGETISLDPSIGNWQFPCKSHYVINRSFIRWAKQWNDERIKENRNIDQKEKRRWYKANKNIVKWFFHKMKGDIK